MILADRYANISIMQRPGINILSDQIAHASKRSISSKIGCAKATTQRLHRWRQTKNMMFRQTASNQMRELLHILGALIRGLTSLTYHMAERKDGAGTPAHIFYFVRCIESLAAFDLINHYIRPDYLIHILKGDVEAHAWALMNQMPAWKRIATHDRVKDMFRNFDGRANGTNGGPPPPPPPPPRGSAPKPPPGASPEPRRQREEVHRETTATRDRHRHRHRHRDTMTKTNRHHQRRQEALTIIIVCQSDDHHRHRGQAYSWHRHL